MKEKIAHLLIASALSISPDIPDQREIKSQLEDLVASNERYIPQIEAPAQKAGSEIDSETGARAIWTYRLPEGILGMYFPSQHIFYVLDETGEKKKNWVYHHENGHASGIEDEKQTDAYAFNKTGYLLRYL